VPPCPGADKDQPVDAGFDRFLGVAHADHVMENDAAPIMHARRDLGRR
jgi:hypothetical protein